MRQVPNKRNPAVLVSGALLSACLAGPIDGADVSWAAEPPAEQMDCGVHDTKTSNIGLAFKIAGFLFKMGPEVTFNQERGVAWDRVVQGFIAKYKELCSRYNAGMVTKEEYGQRLREMEALHREAVELERKMMEETRTRAKAADSEMDRLLSQRKAAEPPAADPIKISLEDLSRRIDAIDIKRKTKKEKFSDAMGTMGRETPSAEPKP